jgi:hypothetical protein
MHSQDSREEKEREIPHMDRYYGNAVFNIAASAAENSAGGLFQETVSARDGLLNLPVAFCDENGEIEADMSMQPHSQSPPI